MAVLVIVAYNGYTSIAKVSDTKAKFETIKKYILPKILKCNLS